MSRITKSSKQLQFCCRMFGCSNKNDIVQDTQIIYECRNAKHCFNIDKNIVSMILCLDCANFLNLLQKDEHQEKSGIVNTQLFNNYINLIIKKFIHSYGSDHHQETPINANFQRTEKFTDMILIHSYCLGC